MIGTILDGRYRILRQLGKGGMGEVYLAEHLALGRKEALKILQAALAHEPQFVSRFRREARATNRVQHANIVSVYDFGQLPDGRFYLTMEFADGQRLDRVLLREGALPVSRVVNIVAQLAEAVDHAHSRGVIHRDLKPENLVLVEHRGRSDVLKILDFGIAKIIAPDHQETLGLTKKGEIYGTACYMSPEQFQGNGSEPRIDIYAIGCITFELLVGVAPFSGRTMEMMHAHLTRAPDRPSERRPEGEIPALLDEVVLRCMEKDPAQRFQTGRELIAELEKLPGYRSYRGMPSGRRGRLGFPSGEFDALDHELPPEKTGRFEAPPMEPSDPADEEEARTMVRAGLRELAETLIDLGTNDMQLVIGVASLNELEDDLRRNENDRERAEAEMAHVEQSARERESSLRFALGELCFLRSQTEGAASPDLQRQIGALEQRLAAMAGERAADVNDLTERAIALAAERAGIEDRLEAVSASVERIVVALAVAHLANETVQAGLQRIQRARAAADRAANRE